MMNAMSRMIGRDERIITVEDAAGTVIILTKAEPTVDFSRLEEVLIILTDSKECESGGPPGSKKAQAFLLERFQEIGLKSVVGSYEQTFSFRDVTDAKKAQTVQSTLKK